MSHVGNRDTMPVCWRLQTAFSAAYRPPPLSPPFDRDNLSHPQAHVSRLPRPRVLLGASPHSSHHARGMHRASSRREPGAPASTVHGLDHSDFRSSSEHLGGLALLPGGGGGADADGGGVGGGGGGSPHSVRSWMGSSLAEGPDPRGCRGHSVPAVRS